MRKFLPLLLIASLFVFFGCSNSTDDEKEVNEFEVLVNYLEKGDVDYQGWVNNLDGWILHEGSWGDSTQAYDDYYVLDFRSEEAFNNKHIPNAHRVTLATMFEEAAKANKKILCVCYTGQTAAYAHMLLRLKGYEAYTLKFGMSSYAKSTDSWTKNCSSKYSNDPVWVTSASPALPSFDYPTLNTGKTEAKDILDARIEEAIKAWPALITADDAISNKDDYNIVNYWGETDYTGLGHINGSYQVTPKTLKTSENLKVFDPKGENILYCYTGQTAAATIAYLKVLGYDVKSIKFGTCAMIWDKLNDAGKPRWPKPYGD